MTSSTNSDSSKYIARYIENFIDLVENTPNDLSRKISQVHEMQLDYETSLNKLEHNMTRFSCRNGQNNQLKQLKLLFSTQHCLLQMQEISDNKLAVIQDALDQLETKSRELDHDYRLISASSTSNDNQTVNNNNSTSGANSNNNNNNNTSNNNNSSTNNNNNGTGSTSKNNKNGCSNNKNQSSTSTSQTTSQTQPKRESTPEPTYCICHQVSYGDMICCDNDACDIEWFHFNCVSLTSKPKGKWYCPNCRGDRSNQPKK